MSSRTEGTESEDAIIKALIRSSPLESSRQELSWTELLQQSGVSRRTLNLRLKDMEKRGLIKRRVDTSSGKYPPPVYYRLVLRNPKVDEILSQHKVYDRTVEKELTFNENPEEFIQKLTSRISPIVIYALLKSIESVSDRSLTDTLEHLRFTIKKFLVYKQPFDESDIKELGKKFAEIDRNPEPFKTQLDSLLTILRQRFPEEVEPIEKVYRRPVKRKVSRGPSLNPRGRPKKSATKKENTT